MLPPIGLAMPPNAGLNERLPRVEGQITFRPGHQAGQEVASERIIRPVWAVENGIVIARLDRIVARVGDRVVLQAELEPSADDAASYRGAPEFTHVVVGATPVLHVGRRK